MIINSFATLFSGGEGASIGAKFAGLQHDWGIEHDAQIANVATKNGFDVMPPVMQAIIEANII